VAGISPFFLVYFTRNATSFFAMAVRFLGDKATGMWPPQTTLAVRVGKTGALDVKPRQP
jgi:hypothetical protein